MKRCIVLAISLACSTLAMAQAYRPDFDPSATTTLAAGATMATGASSASRALAALAKLVPIDRKSVV